MKWFHKALQVVNHITFKLVILSVRSVSFSILFCFLKLEPSTSVTLSSLPIRCSRISLIPGGKWNSTRSYVIAAWPAPTIGNRGNLRLGGVMLVSQVFLALRRAGRAGVNRWRFVRFVQRRARHTVDVGRHTMSFGGDKAALVSSYLQPVSSSGAVYSVVQVESQAAKPPG
ncbi:hypothetical protein CCM_01399 [Cordyceps militaris CM01]|uniref:Uncharacterized protein n=1 Tax=Cordyceps militaris (strain CM01) TaxID=983644 RepID=G3J4S6_CORMM|nr:uncharacterized protein CCM_01399 [Cordyceps militaris CM01]EGX96741.1 hypothetical protein CCM_01399 [Cordyceps militaris CM01]